jgi:ABC-type branched-subunit amino acid transport system substrate-binding protein
MLTIRAGDPEAVILIGSYAPAAEFIKLAREMNFNPLFMAISFVGANALASELGGAGAGVVVTQVVPFPDDASLPIVARYQAALKAAVPEAAPGFVSLEGYVVGRLVIAALETLSGVPTREKLLATIQNRVFELDGVTMIFGRDDNQGMDRVYLTVIGTDGSIRPITSLAPPGG